MFKSPINRLYLTLFFISISILACSQPAATTPISTMPEAKEAQPETVSQPLINTVPKSDSSNPNNSTITDKTTITCDLDISKQLLVCNAYPIPNNSSHKWSSNIGGW